MTAPRHLLALLALTLGAGPTLPPAAAQGAATAARPATYTNPVISDDFPDPFILRVDKTYYAYGTNSGGVDLPVLKSTDLVTWQRLGEGFGRLGSWATGGFTWAPEVARTSAGYVLYYTARHTDSGRQCIGVAFSTSPAGPFRDEQATPLVCQLDLGGSIDASPFTDKDGKRYLYWKNDGNCCGGATGLWVQPLTADGLKLTGKPKDVLYNGALWEGNLIEAPHVYSRAGKYYLFYSAADYNSDTYAVGYALGFSPTGPFKKMTRDEPWLATRGKVAGPGGQGVINDGKGNTWLYYHAWTAGQTGYQSGGQRSMRIDPLNWVNGIPRLKGPSLTPQVAPARP
ncbi:glycoside hydrolase family 43 protein (plasmid) [Deinococcus taeanensis]|uniref:glycoside hydrolase family 43 protein n=1 Tax=Deinococcus taeanensis TaxID=2737050 RepID=UPI001CDC4D34|nr:glycoside hydrolase family 43 protein [Deinococcus taeanensis]UBV44220.1 glycoside hydrolase family 43 protein [Deinococcus taeanensis]